MGNSITPVQDLPYNDLAYPIELDPYVLIPNLDALAEVKDVHDRLDGGTPLILSGICAIL